MLDSGKLLVFGVKGRVNLGPYKQTEALPSAYPLYSDPRRNNSLLLLRSRDFFLFVFCLVLTAKRPIASPNPSIKKLFIYKVEDRDGIWVCVCLYNSLCVMRNFR